MSLFGRVVRTAVNVVTLPVAVAKDTVMAMADAGWEGVGHRTAKKLQQIKDEADD